MLFNIDTKRHRELKIYPSIFPVLLLDRTTGRNIIWGTNDYSFLGDSYSSRFPITKELISGLRANIIQPRIEKTKEKQSNRTKGKAEVFTPAWLCNEQNNLIDEAWFGKSGIFNITGLKSWKTTTEKIKFPVGEKKTWQKYVDERRLEIACGEAPYLVSRYDSTTGKIINIEDRIGLLDRKLRVVSENTTTETEWIKWSERAFQSIYGFDIQGDSLFIARENLLFSYIDYMEFYLKRQPTKKELRAIASVVSWNIWQMDAFTMTVPYKIMNEQYEQISFFEDKIESEELLYCKIKNWRSKEVVDFIQLTTEGVKL